MYTYNYNNRSSIDIGSVLYIGSDIAQACEDYISG